MSDQEKGQGHQEQHGDKESRSEDAPVERDRKEEGQLLEGKGKKAKKNNEAKHSLPKSGLTPEKIEEWFGDVPW